MEIKINLTAKKLYFLLVFILLSLSFVFADNLLEWTNSEMPQSHTDTWVKSIYSKNNDNNIYVRYNLTLVDGKEIKINDKSVLSNILAEQGVNVVRSKNNEIKIIGSGVGISGYEKVSNICKKYGSISCSVSCPSGKKVLGGGCDIVNNVIGSYFEKIASNSDNTKWDCVLKDTGNTYRELKSIAICASV